MPVANGSRVPPCPILGSSLRRTPQWLQSSFCNISITPNEVTPACLSTSSAPCMSAAFRLFFLGKAAEELVHAKRVLHPAIFQKEEIRGRADAQRAREVPLEEA